MRDRIHEQLTAAGFSNEDIRIGNALNDRALISQSNIYNAVHNCSVCDVRESCTQTVKGTGTWNSPLMIVGGAPGDTEDVYGMPYLGAAGSLLSMILAKAGIDRNAVFTTYAMKCKPEGAMDVAALTQCSRHLANEIETVNPHVILTFGEEAMRSLHGNHSLQLHGMRGKPHTITKHGRTIEVLHTYSIEVLLKAGEHQAAFKGAIWEDIVLAKARTEHHDPHAKLDRVGVLSLVPKPEEEEATA